MDRDQHQLHYSPSAIDQIRSTASTPISTFDSPVVPATSLAPRPTSYQRSSNQTPRPVGKSPHRASKQLQFDDIPESGVLTPVRNSRDLRDTTTPKSTGQRSYPSSPRNSLPSNNSTPTRQNSTASTRTIFTRADDRSPLQKLELELKHIGKEEGLIGADGAGGLGISRSLSKKQAQRLQRSTTVTSRVTSREYPIGPITDSNENRMTSSPSGIGGLSLDEGEAAVGGQIQQPPLYPYLADKAAQRNDPVPATFADRARQEQLNGKQRQDRGSQLIMGQEHSRNRSASSVSSVDENGHTPKARGSQDRGRGQVLPQGSSDTDTSERKVKRKSGHHGIHLHHRKSHERSASNGRTGMFHNGSLHNGPDGNTARLTLADQDVAVDERATTNEADESTSFNPPLTVKCGPLLRYLGLRQERFSSRLSVGQEIVEVWRGSILIVTTDDASTYSPEPSLRLFLQSPPLGTLGDSEIPPAAATTMTATGEARQVLPTTEIPHQKDLSHEAGIGELTGSSNGLGYGRSSSKRGSKQDGERSRKCKQVVAQKLHIEHGVTFWRFNIEVELGNTEQRIAYRINNGPAIGFWVPGKDQSMNIMFHSCNGFSLSVNPDDFNGPDPLWRDVLRAHATRPYHVMLGGGDQLYNDCVTMQTVHFKDWLEIHNPTHKFKAPFTDEMREELELFYMERYAMWFSQGLFGVANSQIPMINIWDDHDIIDGFGSYPETFNACPVFAGLGNVAFKYYMLFQHQTLLDEGENHEPSWLLGANPGPFITEQSRSNFMFLGRRIGFLGLDCRTERTRDLLLTDETYTRVFARLEREVVRGQTKHLIILLGVPIAYPRLVWLENILTSSLMDPLKFVASIGHGTLGGFMNKFDGSVELLDDMMDHWTARGHKQERNWLIQEMQKFAEDKGVRVTFLGGDVHLATFGQFQSKSSKIPKQMDHRYMLNVVSSAIVNTPPPNTLADLLNKRNKVHKLAGTTVETQVKIFFHDPKGKKRNNNSTLPARNYCNISENTDGRQMNTSRDVQEPLPIKGESYDRTGGLDCVINCEIDQHDPSGKTKAYGITVPTLELLGPGKVGVHNESTSTIGQSNASRSTAGQ